MNGLSITELKSPGVFSRLLGKKKENAPIEIRNKLATTPIREVSPDFLRQVFQDYGVKPNDLAPHFKELYAAVLRHFVKDRELSDEEVEDLKHLRRLFALTDRDLQDVEGGVYHEALQIALADRQLSQEEKTKLDALLNRLRLPQDVAQTIYKETSTELMQRVLDEIVADRRLSPEEEGQLASLAQNLGIEVSHSEATRATLDRYRLLWRIEQGDVPQVEAPVHLQRGERCHGVATASHYEIRTVTRTIRYAGPTGRIRIMKGVYWRMGSLSIDRVTEDVLTLLDTGTLYITSKRLLFDGGKKSVSIPLAKIINFTVYKNGIQIERDRGKDQFFESAADLELLGVILDAAIATSKR